MAMTRVTPDAMNTPPAPTKTMVVPTTKGPPSAPRPSNVAVAPFEATSSVEVRATDGRMDCTAGRTSVDVAPTTAAKTNTVSRSSTNAASPDPTSAKASKTKNASSSRSRRTRSPMLAAKGAMAPAGSKRTRPAKPTEDAPPWSYAKTPRATK